MEDFPGLLSRELGFPPKTTSSTESSDATLYRRSGFGDSGGFEDLEKFFAGGAPNPRPETPPPPNPDDDLLGLFKHSARADGDLLGDLSGREGGGGKVAGGLPGLEELIIGFGTSCSPRGRELRERGKETISQNISCFLSQGLEESPKSDIPDSNLKENPGYFGPQQGQGERLEQEKEWKSSGRERQCEVQREGDKVAAEKAIREVRERAIAEIQRRSQRAAAEAHQNSERLALKRANAEVRECAARLLAQRTRGAKGEKEYLKARERVAKTCVVVDTWETELKDKATRDEAATHNQKIGQREAQRAAVDAQARCTRFSVERANARAQRMTVASEMQHWSEIDLDSFFGMGCQTNSKTRQNAASAEFSFDAEFGLGGMWASSSGSSTTNDGEKSSANVDDLTSVFGDFEEINGEPEERQRARLKRNQKALDRAAKALAEKIERDSILQREQVERDKIAEGLNVEIKSWAACKESNLQALLSTLQYVLWPGCGWQPVSLSDLITSDSVKKVYRKATLCVHPDKVQQKGATLEQKIIAEKVFDLLKEAWSKFNSEELF